MRLLVHVVYDLHEQNELVACETDQPVESRSAVSMVFPLVSGELNTFCMK